MLLKAFTLFANLCSILSLQFVIIVKITLIIKNLKL